MSEREAPDSGPCPYDCGHEWGEHDLVATGGDITEGGIILCPEPLCQCYSTWSTDGKPKSTVREPGEAEVAELRAELQGLWAAWETELS